MSAADAATVSASTKRPPTAAGGKVGPPATYLTGLSVVPLLPASADLVQEAQLKNPREGKVTYVFGDTLPDILEGDILVVDGVEYLIHMVKEWPRPDTGSFLEVLVAQRKVGA